MIKFINNCEDQPFRILRDKYNEALSSGQRSIEALAISSLSSDNEVESRFVNLKIVDGQEFIFFSNYNSPKSTNFSYHDQISALIYWNEINIQIRIKAKIKRTSKKFNNEYFKQRSPEKNALAISSNQSRKISSYEKIVKNFNDIKGSQDLTKCPDYWGGFVFKPYDIEFWEGHRSRLNRRDHFKKNLDGWEHNILEP